VLSHEGTHSLNLTQTENHFRSRRGARGPHKVNGSKPF
jgi:hypothetical protein